MEWALRWCHDLPLEAGLQAWAVAACGDPTRGVDAYYVAAAVGAATSLLLAGVGSSRLEVVGVGADRLCGRRDARALVEAMDEQFTCDVTIDARTRAPVVASAGKAGYVHIYNPLAGSKDGGGTGAGAGGRAPAPGPVPRVHHSRPLPLTHSLEGHGKFVNHVQWHPACPRRNLFLFSASADGSVRLWNVASGCQVARFIASASGVLSVDVHPSGALLAACGIDTHVRLWDLTAKEEDGEQEEHVAPGERRRSAAAAVVDVQATMDESLAYDPVAEARPFRTRDVLCPAFATQSLHSDYVDSVHFLEPRPPPASSSSSADGQRPPLSANVGALAVDEGAVMLLTKQADGKGHQQGLHAGHRMLRWAPAPVVYDPSGCHVLAEYYVGQSCDPYFHKAAVHCRRRPAADVGGGKRSGGGSSSSSSAAAAADSSRVSALVAVGDTKGYVREWRVDDVERQSPAGVPPSGSAMAVVAAGGGAAADDRSVATASTTDDGDWLASRAARSSKRRRETSPTAAAAASSSSSAAGATAGPGRSYDGSNGGSSKLAAAAATVVVDDTSILPYKAETAALKLQPPKDKKDAGHVIPVRSVAFSPCGRVLLVLMTTGRLTAYERVS
jgi:hypothetical protein